MIDAQNQRMFAVMVSQDTVKRFTQFYQQFDLMQFTVDFIVDRYESDPKIIKSLADGYEDMANLNQEITAEFTYSEEDAELVLTRRRTKLINLLR